MSGWWRVEVKTHDGTLVAIEPGMLAGKGELSPTEEDVIRECAEHLLGFVGPSEPAPCFLCGRSGEIETDNNGPIVPCLACSPVHTCEETPECAACDAAVHVEATVGAE
jgi:hypothetical protein